MARAGCAKPWRPTAEGEFSNEAPEVAFLNANGRESKQPSEETTQGPAEANTAPARPNTNEATTKTVITRERKRRSRGEAAIVLDDHGQHSVGVVSP